jgi:hypothetical protein
MNSSGPIPSQGMRPQSGGGPARSTAQRRADYLAWCGMAQGRAPSRSPHPGRRRWCGQRGLVGGPRAVRLVG